jgi:hypothetical protein
MKNKICLIRQSAGIGDIIFCRKIGLYYYNKGYDVIWPVIKEFSWLNDYINDNKINYCLVNNDFLFKGVYQNLEQKNIFESKNFIFIPLHVHNLLDSSVMKSKYKLVDLTYEDWNKYFNLKRNYIKEKELYFEILKLKENEKYILVNRNFASPPDILQKNFIVLNDTLKIINMNMIEGFTLFDWCKVIENAEEIYTVETSINYIIDKLDIKAKKLELFSKHYPADYHHIEGLFKTKWHYNA